MLPQLVSVTALTVLCAGQASFELLSPASLVGVSKLLASLGHTGRRAVLGHTLNTQKLMKTDEQKRGFK